MSKIKTKNSKMEFIFHTEPIAQQRPRLGKGVVYNPQQKDKTKMKFQAALQARNQGVLKPLESPISFFMRIDKPMPKTWSKKRKNEMIGKPRPKKPDSDNYEKFYFDVLSGIAYVDDAQITQNITERFYAWEPMVKIFISEHITSLFDEIISLGKMGVKMHETITHLYHFSENLCETYPNKKEIQKVSAYVKEKCLEGGLFENYNNFGSFPEKHE